MKTNLIIERLFIYFKVDTNAALAQKLGVSATTLSNWKSRNTINYDLIFTKCEGINFNWLLCGEGEMSVKESPPGRQTCELCSEKEKRIDALERIIETQAKLIDKYEEDCSSSGDEQKRKAR